MRDIEISRVVNTTRKVIGNKTVIDYVIQFAMNYPKKR